jgi:hypothetical protein
MWYYCAELEKHMDEDNDIKYSAKCFTFRYHVWNTNVRYGKAGYHMQIMGKMLQRQNHHKKDL